MPVNCAFPAPAGARADMFAILEVLCAPAWSQLSNERRGVTMFSTFRNTALAAIRCKGRAAGEAACAPAGYVGPLWHALSSSAPKLLGSIQQRSAPTAC